MREFTVFQSEHKAVWAAAFSPDGRWFAAGGKGGGVRVWDTLSEAKPVPLKDSTAALAIAFRPQGLILSYRTGVLQHRRWPGQKVIRQTQATSVWIPDQVAFTPDGRVVHYALNYTAAPDELVCWNPIDGTQCWAVQAERGYFERLACGPAERLVIAERIHRLTLRNSETGEIVATRKLRNAGGEAMSPVFSPDGQTLAFAAGDDLLLWDVAAWKERARVRLTDPCTRLAYRPDGSALLGFDGGAFRLWEPDLKREVRAYDLGVTEVNCLLFDPAGQRVAAGTGDGRVVMWDLD